MITCRSILGLIANRGCFTVGVPGSTSEPRYKTQRFAQSAPAIFRNRVLSRSTRWEIPGGGVTSASDAPPSAELMDDRGSVEAVDEVRLPVFRKPACLMIRGVVAAAAAAASPSAAASSSAADSSAESSAGCSTAGSSAIDSGRDVAASRLGACVGFFSVTSPTCTGPPNSISATSRSAHTMQTQRPTAVTKQQTGM